MINTILGGRYKILEEVGKGGMAYVYKAHCNVLNRIVAVKVLRNDLEGGEEFVNRFKAEAQSAACLTHPNIVSIYDVGEEGDLYYIVMEYIEGITLKEYIKQKGRLSSKESADIASQICGALSVAHEKNIIHRDIKPHNIMITSNNLVKVTDFGIARASNNSTMRVGDSILGSVHYISPEQARGGYVDCRSDIYSLGIVLYEMLTGKVPFESESPIAVAMKHLEETPINPTTLCPDACVELQDVILKAISKETRKRYQTVDAFKSDLDVIVQMLSTNTTVPVPEETVENAEIFSDEETANQDSLVTDIPQEPEIGYDYDDDYSDEDSENNYDDIEEDDEEPQSRRGLTLNMVIAAVLIALVVVGGGFFAALYFVNPDAPIFMFFKDNDVDVPDFTGMHYTKAEELAAKYGLVLEVGDRTPGPEDKDFVIYQSITQGNSVKKGTNITVHLSMGLENVDVASFKGMSADVIDDFKKKGYEVEVKYKSSTEIDEDKIISVKVVGEKYIFTVSTGSGDLECVVPKLIMLTEDEAREKLEENGLLLDEEVKYVVSDVADEGLVVEQSIEEGEKVKAKTKIKISVSKKGNEDETSGESTSDDASETLFTYTIDKNIVNASTKIKIVETTHDGKTNTIFEETIDPNVQDEISLKVKGVKGKKNKYTVYHDEVPYLSNHEILFK